LRKLFSGNRSSNKITTVCEIQCLSWKSYGSLWIGNFQS
jgi:hypothetical protein